MEYECDSGFGLNPGPTVRSCSGNQNNTVGFFDGTASTCDSKLMIMNDCLLPYSYIIIRQCICIAAITCSLSNPPNGNISFSAPPEMNEQYPIGTTAAYSCNIGYSLVPSPTVRTCVGDGSSAFGSFDGNEPACEGKFKL